MVGAVSKHFADDGRYWFLTCVERLSHLATTSGEHRHCQQTGVGEDTVVDIDTEYRMMVLDGWLQMRVWCSNSWEDGHIHQP